MNSSFNQWLQNEPLGQYILQKEQAFYDKACADIFGLYSLQLGLSDIPLLQKSRIPTPIRLGTDPNANLFASPEHIPCDWRSVDLVVLPHALELSDNPHQILSEVQRILVPEGKIIITGFNPASFFGIRKQLKPYLPPRKQMVGLWRLKDWLKLLGFKITAGQFMVYTPPFHSDKNINRFQFMEKAGNRWWPQLAAVYALVAVKEVYNMTPIMPEWKKRTVRKPTFTEAKNEQKTALKKEQQPE